MSVSPIITEGIGPQSSIAFVITLGYSIATATVPNAPTIGIATAGDKQAIVSFIESTSDGGSTILSHTATSSPGGIIGTSLGAGSGTITVTGLRNGTTYTFTVHSTNVIGNSPESGPSNSVTPIGSSILPGFDLSLSWSLPIYGATVDFVAYSPITRILRVIYTEGGIIIDIPNIPLTIGGLIVNAADPEAYILNLVHLFQSSG